MTNPTSAFGWQMPTSTDLVTDLPADFEIFGQAVDTTLAELKGGTTGQVLSKTSNTDMDFTWVTTDDANAIQNSIVDAKGDLVAATANDTPARLAVGANFAFLQANSTPATGLAWNNDAFISYTPTLSAGGGGSFTSATVTGKYQRIGKVCVVKIVVNIVTAGTATGSISVSMPFTSANDGNTYAAGSFREMNVTGSTGVGRVVPNLTDCNIAQYNDATFIADGRKIAGTIVYEVQ